MSQSRNVQVVRKILGKSQTSLPTAIGAGGEVELMLDEYGRLELGATDTVTGSLNTVDYAHHEIHSGSHYYIQGFAELATDIALRVKMVTPDTTKWSHFVFSITSSGICETTFDEGASGGMANGSSIVPLNNNRNSTNTSGLVFTSGVTAATTYVTRLENDKWGALGFKSTIGGGTAREDEFILKQNTTYLRTFTSRVDNNIIQFRASWYEHTDKT